MKRKSLFFPFLLILFISLAGCNKSESSGGDTPKVEERIVLNSSKVSLNLNDTFLIEIAYSNVDASKITTFTSSDSNIVSVTEAGFVTAINEGKATVEVNKGSASAECAFTVSLAGEIPYIFIEGINNNHLDIDFVTNYELNPVAAFGGREYQIDNLSFEVIPGTGNGQMDNNIFHPTQKGDLTIKISGEYSGRAMHNYYLSVLVKESIVFTLREKDGDPREYGSVNLFTIDSYKGQSYKTSFSPEMSVVVDGVDKTNELTFELIDNYSVFNYNSSTNTITALTVGTAVLRMHYQDYSKDIPFYSNYLLDKSNIENIVIDASVGEFPNEDIFADFAGDKQIIKATSVDQSVEYEVEDGKVLGIESHNFESQQIIVYNNKIGFIIDFRAYAKIIREPEDLMVFNITVADANAVDRFINDGYYLLANDLDCTGVDYPASTRVLGRGASSVEQRCGFVGTFDGQGHTIKNFKTPKEGLFLVLGFGSVVKNVAFVDAILDVAHGNDRFVLATYCYGAEISNVYINSSSVIGTVVNNALVAGCISSSCHIVNCVFEYTGSFSGTNGFGSLMHLNELGVPQFSSAYMVSPYVMTIYKTYYGDSRTYDEYSDLSFRQYTGIGHYLDYTEMKNAHLSFDTFSATYWNCSTGVPVWKQ